MSTSASSGLEGENSGRPYGGVSAERRLADRRQRLLDAGQMLFAARGLAATTVGDVSDGAGLIKRYFYESFENLEALHDAVIADITAKVNEVVVQAASSGGSTKERARGALAAFVDFMAANPSAGRVLMRETLSSRGALPAQREQLVQSAGEVIHRLFLQGDGDHAPAPAEAHLTSLALAGASAEVIVAWLDGRIDADRDLILDYLAQLYSLATGIRTSL